jgi:glutamyl/glutaminyl-tRNA synthetase
MSDRPTVRTRFAPSPSGHLHVGSARTALFCWAYARGRDGKFILRIEDTDRKRSSDAASMAFLEDLKWLGLQWDEGPYYQSERLAHYDRAIDRLLEDGKAYRAFETPEEIEAARAAAREAKRAYIYDRAALRLDSETVRAYLAEGRPHVVRFQVPDHEEIAVRDAALGVVRVDTDEIGDFVIRKQDGYPTYHLAVVVDDEEMGVTHVIRGQDHLINTPRHVLLQRALGYATPIYAHNSLTFNVDGTKMSKRDRDRALRRVVEEREIDSVECVDDESWSRWRGDAKHQLELEQVEALANELRVHLPEVHVDDFRRAGYLPEVLVNFIALLGWSPGRDIEKFDAAFLVERFDFDRMVRSPAKFDRDKLLAFNLDALQAMEEGEFTARFKEHCARYHPEFVERLGDEQFALLASANKKRAKTLEDPIESCRFFVQADDDIVYERTKGVEKALSKGETPGLSHLAALRPLLADAPDFGVETLESVVQAYADAHTSGKLGKVAQPLRIAVSGTTVSPAIFETLAILGRDAVLRRVDRCLSFFA